MDQFLIPLCKDVKYNLGWSLLIKRQGTWFPFSQTLVQLGSSGNDLALTINLHVKSVYLTYSSLFLTDGHK